MDFKRFTRTLRRHWTAVLVVVLLGALAGFMSAAVAVEEEDAPPPVIRFEATHTLIRDANLTVLPGVIDTRNLTQLALRMTKGEVPARVAEATGLDQDDVESRIFVVVDSESETLNITTVAETPTEAERLADEYAEQTLGVLSAGADVAYAEQELELLDRIDDLETAVAEAEAELDLARETAPGTLVETEAATLLAEYRRELTTAVISLDDLREQGPPPLTIRSLETAAASEIDEATYEQRLRLAGAGNNVLTAFGTTPAPMAGTASDDSTLLPSGPVGRAVAGGFLGLALAFTIVWLWARFERHVWTKDDVEDLLDLPVIAEIPHLRRRDLAQGELVVARAPRSRSSEQYRVLRSSVDYAAAQSAAERGDRAPVVLITSASPAEGKTTVASNLSAVLAEAEREVLLVNCDFRRPRVHEVIGVDDSPLKVHDTGLPGLFLVNHVADGESEMAPSEVVAAQRRVVGRATERYDMVVLDTAPLLTTNDANDLVDVADQVVLVVRPGSTRRDELERAVEMLARRRARVLGVVLVGARDLASPKGYYYDGDDPYLRTSRASKRRSRRFWGRRRARRAEAVAEDAAGPDERVGELIEA